MQAVVDAFNHSQNHMVVGLPSISPIDRKTLMAATGGDGRQTEGFSLELVVVIPLLCRKNHASTCPYLHTD